MKTKLLHYGSTLLIAMLLAGDTFAGTDLGLSKIIGFNIRHRYYAMAVDSGPSVNIGYITMSTTAGSCYFNGSLNNLVSSGSAATIATNAGTVVVATNLNNGAGAVVNHGTAPITVGEQGYTGSTAIPMNTFTNSGTYNQTTGKFTAGSVYNKASGILNLGTVGGDFIINDNTAAIGGVNYAYYNLGTYTQSTATTYFSGTTTQTLFDNSSAGTLFKLVTFNGGNTATMLNGAGVAAPGNSAKNFMVDPTGILTMAKNGSNNTTLVAGSSTTFYLTLLSNASSTATVANIPSGCTISGFTGAQRYITGGNGYRGYRLLSSPVNASTNTSGGGSFSFGYINTTVGSVTGAFTGGPGGNGNGFTYNNPNPTLYVYNETLSTQNNTYITGKDIGITAITGSTVSLSNGVTNQSIGVGNGYLMYFIGPNTRATPASTTLPVATTITATGTLNQGTIPVTIWSNSSTSLPYTPSTATTTPGGAVLAGLNQLGNPYASTISLDQFWADNNPSGSTSGISSFFYELQEPGQAYITYDASPSHRSSSSNAGPYIVSGQGFVTQAQGTGQTITFKETEKVNNQITSSTTPTLLLALKTKNLALAPTPANAPAGLHLQLSKDSLTNTQTGIYFSSAWNDKYTSDDAADLGGFATLGLSSLSSDGVRLGINSMGDYITGKRVKLFVKANTTAQYTLKMADVKNIDAIYNIFLVDNLLKDSVNLRTNNYNFTITTTDTTTFGANRFVLAVELKALPPYKLVTFTGKKANTGIQLAWTTSNEGYYTGFVLQKQTGTKFIAIDSLQGNSSGNYSYLDANAALGLNTYRLKQIDAAGNITYSALVNVNTSTNGAVLSIYPNPTRDGLGVMVNQAPNAYNLNIYNSMGALVKQVFMSSNTWEGSVAAYNPGTYIIEVVDKKGNFVGKDKFVKLQ